MVAFCGLLAHCIPPFIALISFDLKKKSLKERPLALQIFMIICNLHKYFTFSLHKLENHWYSFLRMKGLSVKILDIKSYMQSETGELTETHALRKTETGPLEAGVWLNKSLKRHNRRLFTAAGW